MSSHSAPEAAMQELLEDHWGAVHGFARRLCSHPPDAEEVAQQTFLQAFGALASFEGRSSLRTWLLRIAVRVAARQFSRRERQEGLEGEPTSSEPTPPEHMVAGERAQHVARAIEALPRHHRLVLVLFTVEGLSHAEIATVLECPEGTVWSRLHHAKQALRRALAHLEEA